MKTYRQDQRKYTLYPWGLLGDGLEDSNSSDQRLKTISKAKATSERMKTVKIQFSSPSKAAHFLGEGFS